MQNGNDEIRWSPPGRARSTRNRRRGRFSRWSISGGLFLCWALGLLTLVVRGKETQPSSVEVVEGAPLMLTLPSDAEPELLLVSEGKTQARIALPKSGQLTMRRLAVADGERSIEVSSHAEKPGAIREHGAKTETVN